MHAIAQSRPPLVRGLILIGTILPKADLLPVLTVTGEASSTPAGPDRVTGYDARGRVLVTRTFADEIYSFDTFLHIDDAQLANLQRLVVDLGSQHVRIVRIATKHGPPAADAVRTDALHVRVRWNERAFPRLACHDENNGSPMPLMLHGDFTGYNVIGARLRCDFSDGVKTAFASVPIPIRTR